MLSFYKKSCFWVFLLIIIIIISFLFLFSCAGMFLSLERKERIKKLDPVTEEYYRQAMEAKEKKDIYNAIKLLSRAQKREPRHPVIKKAISDILLSIQTEAFYSPEIIQIGSGLTNPLQFIVSYKTDNESYPVSDIPVNFTFEKGSGILTENAITDHLGIARCYVEKITDYRQIVIIEARVDISVDLEMEKSNHLILRYIFSDRSILDIPRVVVLYLEKESWVLTDDYKALLEIAVEPYRKSGFSKVTPVFTDEGELFNRAFNLDRAALSILSGQVDSEIVSLIKIKTRFLSQIAPNFFYSLAELESKSVDIRSFSIEYTENAAEKGAGSTEEESRFQAISGAFSILNRKTEKQLTTLRRSYEFQYSGKPLTSGR